MRTSYSVLQVFKSCPLKYKFKTIDKVKPKPSAVQAFGNLVHKTLKFTYTPLSHGFPDKEEVLDYFSQNWKQEILKKEGEEQGYFEEGLRMISAYMDSIDNTIRNQVIALEHHFNVKIGGHEVEGYIDRIDRTKDGFEIIDYKTSQKVPPEENVKSDLQLSIYLRAFMSEWPTLFEKIGKTEKIKLTLFYIRHNLPLSVRRSQKDLKIIDEEVLGLIEGILEAKKNDNFQPNPSNLCSWCDYQEICPVWSHKYKPLSKEEREKEVQGASQKYIELKGKKKAIESEIKEVQIKIDKFFVDEGLDQFFTSFGSILRSSRKTYSFDPQEVAKAFLEWKKDPLSVMKVDSAALKKIGKELTPAQKALIEKMKKLQRESFSLSVKSEKSKRQLTTLRQCSGQAYN